MFFFGGGGDHYQCSQLGKACKICTFEIFIWCATFWHARFAPVRLVYNNRMPSYHLGLQGGEVPVRYEALQQRWAHRRPVLSNASSQLINDLQSWMHRLNGPIINLQSLRNVARVPVFFPWSCPVEQKLCTLNWAYGCSSGVMLYNLSFQGLVFPARPRFKYSSGSALSRAPSVREKPAEKPLLLTLGETRCCLC